MKRLRDKHTSEKLREIYPKPHDHTRWWDHRLRVAVTADLANALVKGHRGPVDALADLSAGDGTIQSFVPANRRILGDYAAGYEYTGPIETTVHLIPPVNLFICCETLEHLDDPLSVLKAIRHQTEKLVLSTPVENWEDQNEEHYWAWSRSDVDNMLHEAGFKVEIYTALDFRMHGPEYYQFGIWAAK